MHIYKCMSSETANKSHVFYPEMGGTPDLNRIFYARYTYKGYSVQWKVSDHERAQALLKSLRIRPQHLEIKKAQDMIGGTTVFGAVDTYQAHMTAAAHEKIVPYVTTEQLLD